MKALPTALALALYLLPTVALAFPVTVLQETGPITRRYNIAVLGDGYRADDQAKLTIDARTLIRDIFEQSPYASYRGLFNIKVVQAVSVDQGAKNGTAGGSPNTIFDANFACEGVSRLLCVDERAVLAAAARDVPEFNLAIVIVNDTKYGGSGGDVPCVSTNRLAADILRHELGHNLADLADEYETPYSGYPACSRTNDCREPNVTLRNTRANVKWLDWIPPATQVPTPEGAGVAGVGLFEGARYLSSGVYRPVERACKMRTIGQPFCPVCAEGLVRAFWNLPNVGLIDAATPAGEARTDTCSPVTFSVTTPTVDPSTLTFSWSVDGQPHAGGPKAAPSNTETAATASLVVEPRLLSAAQHVVAVTVKDATALVRSDPQRVLQEEHTWGFTAAGCFDAASVDAPGGGVVGEDGTAGNFGQDGSTRGDASAAIDSAVTPPPDAAGTAETGGAGASESIQGCACRIIGPRPHDRKRDVVFWSLIIASAAVSAWRRRRVAPSQARS